MFLNSKNLVTVTLFAILSFAGLHSFRPACAQDSPTTVSTITPTTTENWFGWIDSPEQQLRTIVRIERDQDSKVLSSVIVSPDQSSLELPLTDFVMEMDGAVTFTLNNPYTAKLSATYAGKRVADNRVVGEFSQNGQKLPLNLERLRELPVDKPNTAGADSVWTGTLNIVIQKKDLRFRVYNSPPYATPDAPRVLFDLVSDKAFGIPASVSMDAERKVTFELNSKIAKFVATLNDTADELTGNFIQSKIPMPLTMKLLKTDALPSKASTDSSTMPADALSSPNLPVEPASPSDAKPTPNVDEHPATSSELYTESNFEVIHSVFRRRLKASAKELGKGIKLSGTLTLPKSKDPKEKNRYPAVVMVTGSGPQDRNETIGKHQPFKVIAHYLAEHGIASLRYDDRGVGASTGNFLEATTVEFANDAVEVWKYARTLESIDPKRVGILGHSEGGIIGPMVATWESEIAFLMMLAPPGMTGGNILKTQLDRMAELQGIGVEERKATMQLQDELQSLAVSYSANESTLSRDIHEAIDKHWDKLKTVALAHDPNADTDQIKRAMTAQIESQFQQLRTPWFQFFLSYDPATNWMLIRCPTLAVWGSNDVQVLADENLDLILDVVKRNRELDVTLEILPGLNHLFQTSESGLPSEYDDITETISPTALETMIEWAKEKGILDRKLSEDR